MINFDDVTRENIVNIKVKKKKKYKRTQSAE